ncbi:MULTISPECIES: ERF family protein [Lactobacillus]|uniref:ERF family protein n=1 Tax=Lactobacillus TaxID=1578 RepID=UPI000CD8AC34|nr:MULTISPECIES: ERF family protein [Lactobacillus]RVU71934.1 hypothetical protein EJK20_11130 [Lactobacillus xujianguonis]
MTAKKTTETPKTEKTAEKTTEAPKTGTPKELTLAEKIALATAEMGAIKKNGYNQGQHFRFISEADIKAGVRKAMGKYHFAIIPSNIKIIGQYERKTSRGGSLAFYDILQEFTITDGKESIKGVAMGTGSDSGDKALNKAMTIAFKNFEKQLFNVSDSDDDPDGESVKVDYSQQQTQQPTRNYRSSQAKPNFQLMSEKDLQNYSVTYKDKPAYLAVIFTKAMQGDKDAQSWWKETKAKINTQDGRAVAQYSTSKFAKEIEREENAKKAVEQIKPTQKAEA